MMICFVEMMIMIEEESQPMRWCKKSEYGGEVNVAKEQVKGEECASDHVLQQRTSVQFQSSILTVTANSLNISMA